MKKVLTLFIAASLGGLAAVGISKAFDGNRSETIEQKQNATFTSYPTGTTVPMFDFTGASELVTPAVVHIMTHLSPSQKQGEDPFGFFGDEFSTPRESEASGSGVIITADGYIATNNHVIEDATSIEVVLNNKKSYRAELVGTDPQTDLALLKIDEAGLAFLKFGNSDQLKVGEWVLAVGNPFNLTSTVTAGIVSAKGRNINLLRTADNQYAIENFIQTDAAVNPGNSGGALVNLKGELIGINTAIASRTGTFAGYSFAVPVNIVKKVMEDLLQYGNVQRGFLGIQIRDIDAQFANENNIKNIAGVYVAEVNAGGAAEIAGIKKGDIVMKINDVSVNSSSELQEQVSRFHPGDNIQVTVLRKGDEKILTARLRNKEGKTEIIKNEVIKENLSAGGADFANISKEDKGKLGVQNGVALKKIGAGSFKDAGIPEGFVIIKVDKKPVFTAQELKRVLDSKKGGILIEGVDKNGKEAAFGIRMQ